VGCLQPTSRRHAATEGRKNFFFEKKKQKTFEFNARRW
jgi:hypothetical protein